MAKDLEERTRELEQHVAAHDRELEEVKMRIMHMDNVLGGLRAALVGTTEEHVIGRTNQSLETHADGAEPASTLQPSEALKRAEALFDTLLSMKPPRLVSYSEAYRRIIGPYADWRNAIHAPEVIKLALRTSPRRAGRFSIRLDALIVGKQTRRPAPGHFTAAVYSESDWIQAFGSWALL